MENIRKFKNGIQIEPKTPLTSDTQGELEVNSVDGKIYYHNGTVSSPLVTEAGGVTVTNVTLTTPTINGGDINGVTLSLNDSDSAFNLEVQSTSTLTADRTLTIDVNDANRTLTITADATLSGSSSGTNTGDVTVSDTATIDLTVVGQLLSADVVAGSIGNTELGTGIDVSQFADGSVSNAEFQFINSLTSNAQDQIDSKVTGPASATDEAIVRFDGTTGKLVQNSVVTITDAGVASGFTQLNVDNLRLDGNTLSSTDTNGNIVLDANGTGQISIEDVTRVLEQASSPATPASGYTAIYSKTDGYLYYKNDSGAETRIQAGSGGINYINNSDFEGGTTGWIPYADAAGVAPVDGIGGSPNITFTASASSPLRGLLSGLITKDAANRQGEGVSYDFTIANADRSKQLAISFDYEASAAYTGSSGTEFMYAYVYDITNAVQIPASFLSSSVPQGSGTQQITFNTTSSNSYRLEFHIAGTGTSAWTYKLDNVMVGPQETTLSAAISDWVTWTPTGSLSTNVTYTGKKRRVGDTAEYEVVMAFSGTNTQGAVTINLDETIDTTKILNTTANWNLGDVTLFDSNVTAYKGIVIYSSTTAVALRYLIDDVGGSSNLIGGSSVDTSANAPFTIASGDIFVIKFKVPIANWSSNIQLNNSRVEYASNSGMGDADDTTSFVNDFNGSPVPVVSYAAGRFKTVRFKNAIQPGDTVQIQMKPNNSFSSWIDITSQIQDAGSATSITNNAATNNGFTLYDVVNSTDLRIYVGRFINSTTNWPGTGTARWRVVKYSNAVPVESNTISSAPLTTVYTSGSGTHTFTGSPTYVTVEMCGGGGGGGASGNSLVTGGTGGTSTFGTSLLTANGGAGGGGGSGDGGAGGTASLGSGPTGVAHSGGRGQGGSSGTTDEGGSNGGSNGFGYFGPGAAIATATNPVVANTGAGGGGASSGSVNGSGGGGGAGGYIKAMISGATLSGLGGSASYAVGAAGAAGTGSSFNGAAGSAGIIIVTEYY